LRVDSAPGGNGDFSLRLPNVENAVIDPEKLRDYLLSPSHPVGRFKAAFFSSLGYTQEDWKQFEADLRQQHLIKDAVLCRETSYGRKYEIRGKITGLAGKAKEVVSIWIIWLTRRFLGSSPRILEAVNEVQDA
jgi:hypothetical protein